MQGNERAAGDDCGRQDFEGGMRHDLRHGFAPLRPFRDSPDAG